MKRVFCRMLLIACVALGSVAVAEEVESDKQVDSSEEARDDVRKLLLLMGAGEVGLQAMEQMIDSFRQSFPWAPSEFWDDFINGVDAADLIELSIDPYVRHLSHEDIRELIAFYESPLGERLTRAMPAITHESMLAGQKWGQQLAEEVIERLEEKGYQ